MSKTYPSIIGESTNLLSLSVALVTPPHPRLFLSDFPFLHREDVSPVLDQGAFVVRPSIFERLISWRIAEGLSETLVSFVGAREKRWTTKSWGFEVIVASPYIGRCPLKRWYRVPLGIWEFGSGKRDNGNAFPRRHANWVTTTEATSINTTAAAVCNGTRLRLYEKCSFLNGVGLVRPSCFNTGLRKSVALTNDK